MAAKLETAVGIFDCLTVDISNGGTRLHLLESFDTASPVVLVFERFGRFPARIAWRATAEIGLQFTDSPIEISRRLVGIL
jgi:hypothetical protein